MAQSIYEGTPDQLITYLRQMPKTERYRLVSISTEDKNDTLSRAILAAQSRTPEQIAKVRARILSSSPPPRPLPEGKTFCEALAGQWPGDETDEQVQAALDELSYSTRKI